MGADDYTLVISYFCVNLQKYGYLALFDPTTRYRKQQENAKSQKTSCALTTKSSVLESTRMTTDGFGYANSPICSPDEKCPRHPGRNGVIQPAANRVLGSCCIIVDRCFDFSLNAIGRKEP